MSLISHDQTQYFKFPEILLIKSTSNATHLHGQCTPGKKHPPRTSFLFKTISIITKVYYYDFIIKYVKYIIIYAH